MRLGWCGKYRHPKMKVKHCRHFIKLVFIFTTTEGTSVWFFPLCGVKRTKLVRRNSPVINWWILLYLLVSITAIYRHVVMSFTRMCVKVATAVSKINRLGVTFLKSLFCEHNNILRKAKNTICWSLKVSFFDTVWTTLFDWHLSSWCS